MYFLTLTFAAAGYFFFQALIIFPLMSRLISNGYSQEKILHDATLLFDSKALNLDPNIVLALMMGMFVMAFLGLFLGLKLIHRKTLVSVCTGYEKFRRSRFFFGFGVWAIMLIVLTVISYFISPEDYTITFDATGIVISLLIMALLMPVQTGFEELVFRGYIVQGLSQVFKNGIVPVIISASLFAFAHMTNPEVVQFGWPIMFCYYCSFALFFGLITLLDEGLELAFGIHLANNLVSSILVSSKHAVLKTYSVFETAEADPYSEIVVWLVMAVTAFFIFRFRYRWNNFNLIIK
jgi:membrane protease YdiL (CAAX protease family)